MKIRNLHRWNVSPADAVQIQKYLVRRLSLAYKHRPVRLIAGADIAFCSPRRAVAGVILFEYPSWRVVEHRSTRARISFPYIPGLLSFREAPLLLKTFQKLRRTPDIVFVDGHGIAHPRGIGLASHLGLFLDRPTIGCAKSRLIGDYPDPPGRAGGCSWLTYRGATVGAALRTKKDCRPVFVSPGHRIDLPAAVELTRHCLDGHRVPLPTRQADRWVGELSSPSPASQKVQ
ncbi:MAG TPA: endonuclease V [Elusimicrobiota bacterium]|nr:endonuclease V [Elusimicrobiota bacterium]